VGESVFIVWPGAGRHMPSVGRLRDKGHLSKVMQNSRRTFIAFQGPQLYQRLESWKRDIQDKISREKEDYILNVNETEYINYLVPQYNLEPIQIDFDQVVADSHEDVRVHERTYRFQVITFFLPFEGSEDLLHLAPNECREPEHPRLFIEDGCICFEIEDLHGNPEVVNRERKKIETALRHMLKHHNEALNEFNNAIRTFAEWQFQQRKAQLLRNRNTLAALKVPIKKRNNLPKTYAIPTPATRHKVTMRPEVADKGYKPEPTLPYPEYQDILQTIFDLGKMFERLPSTYMGKGEEDLRDHILLYLEPRYEGSATGETFNKNGKTDILLRYQNSNVFIAECKFWKGSKAYLDTITQLLGYLTWRDSKAAVIVFVKNKEFSSVLEAVKAATPNHSNYLSFVNEQEETWFNYRFHINNDKNREVRLAIMLFHTS